MSTYEPGTVAVATVRGVEGVRVMPRVTRGGETDGWLSSERVELNVIHRDDQVTDVRPLVVLDPEDSAQIDSLCKALVEAMHAAGDRYSAANGVHPATIRAALESLTKPPRIPEPIEPLSKVEASTEGRERRVFVRGFTTVVGSVRWVDGVSGWGWDELIDPTLVREGVQS